MKEPYVKKKKKKKPYVSKIKMFTHTNSLSNQYFEVKTPHIDNSVAS